MLIPDKEILLNLAQDLPAVWNSPGTEAGLTQRIVRILVEEVVADALAHVPCGRRATADRAADSLGWWASLGVAGEQAGHGTTQPIDGPGSPRSDRRMAGTYADGEIAATLNRLRLRTGAGNSWNAQRVYGLRRQQELPGDSSNVENRTVTLQQAVERLGVCELSIRRMIEQKVLPATQAVPGAPWEISLDALNLPAVQQAVENTRRRKRPPTVSAERTDSLFSES
jgi:hypothetical protein